VLPRSDPPIHDRVQVKEEDPIVRVSRSMRTKGGGGVARVKNGHGV
jgi:hypothetical protein